MSALRTLRESTRAYCSCAGAVAHMEDRLAEMGREVDRWKGYCERARGEHDATLRRLREAEEGRRREKDACDRREEECKGLREENRRLSSMAQQMEAQTAREIRKKERECMKLKSRLLKTMSGSRSREASAEGRSECGGPPRALSPARMRGSWATNEAAMRARDKITEDAQSQMERLREENLSQNAKMYGFLLRLAAVTGEHAQDTANAAFVPLGIGGNAVDDKIEEMISILEKNPPARNDPSNNQNRYILQD